MRAAMDVPNGASAITMNGLIPGNIYFVKALRAAQGQLLTLELTPSKFTAKSAQILSISPERKNSLRFKALSEQVDFMVIANTKQQVTSVPISLSVQCETCAVDEVVKGNSFAESLSNLQVIPNISAQSLISNTLIGGDCFTISNVTTFGNPLARGTFSNGSTNIGIGSGMVMSTGSIDVLPGPNTQEGADGGFGTFDFDEDLAALVLDNDMHDLNIIEFDFTPTANTVQFDFVFGSEEYCEYVGAQYNDVFGFFISGPGISGVQNLAVIPGTGGLPVAINNVNHLSNSIYYVNNSPNLLNCLFSPANHLPECQLDGWTKPLTALATVIPCATYHIKLAIADVSDYRFDSAVFLRANSFNAGGSVSASPAYQQGLGSAYEGCAQGAIRFERGNNDLSQPLTVNFAVSGASTATAGDDYTSLVSPVIIPAGQTEILVPINTIADGLAEGSETILLLIDNACQCQQAEVRFLINDINPFSVHIDQDTTICEGGSTTLTAVTDDGIGPFTYAWTTGDSTQSIVVSPLVSSAYAVTMTSACGSTAVDNAQVDVIPIFRNTITAIICAGGYININGQIYTSATTVIDTSYELFLCGRITTYVITVNDPAQGSETITLCRGESVEIGGNVYNTSGTVIDTLQTVAGCDSIVTYTLVVRPLSYGAETISFCPGEVVEIAGFTYNLPGTVLLTLTAASGCDSIVTYTLTELPNPTRTETIKFCPGTSVSLGGMVYTQPGTVVLTLPASVGCDTIATYILQYLTPAPSVVSITCPLTVSVNVPSGTAGTVVTYHGPSASSDCPCPGVDITQNSGLLSGSTFPLGLSSVCYTAKDKCGQTKSCCFNISVEEENPCDVKVIGCMKYELLTITQDALKNKTYRVRVTNNCASPLIYTAIQTPSGMVAMAPETNSVYLAPSGNEYLVRNPNFSPFYSVRYKAIGSGISNGQSDILRYTLPAQADVTFINITTRLSIQQFYEAHLNTFYCPIGVTPLDDRSDETPIKQLGSTSNVIVFPNPTDGSFQVDLAQWEGETVQMQVFNSQGQRVLHHTSTAAFEPQRIDLPQGIADGLYFLEVSTLKGEKEVLKFVVKH